MIDPRLNGKIALVTGANHGIGAAIAQALAAQGAHVFVHYYAMPLDDDISAGDSDTPSEAQYAARRAQNADAVVNAIRAAGGVAESAAFDLSDPANIPALLDAAEQAFGPVSVLVNNAAAWTGDTFIPDEADADRGLHGWTESATLSAASLDFHLAVNTRGTALLMVEFLRRHVVRGADWGRIVNISTDGAHCFPNEVSYGASKLAMEGLSRSAAREMGPYGITVNVVSPGPVQTGWITPENEAGIAANIPLRRVGQPDDLADAVVFLASHQVRWITGQVLSVGGGNAM